MKFDTTRNGCLELWISEEPDWREFERLYYAIHKAFDARMGQRLDGIDERYWDMDIAGRTVTLHLQHYLGIMLFAASPDGDEIV